MNGNCPECRVTIQVSDLKAMPRANRFGISMKDTFEPSAKITWLVNNLPKNEKSVVFS